MARLLAIFALCCYPLLAAAAGEQVAIPPLKAHINDQTGSLPAGLQADLEAKLAAFEARKGSQIVLLVLPSTQPESIEQFGVRLLDTWKVGRPGIDDGVILLVAKTDHRLRIEVGYGLEGVLNDATAKRIIAETITPHFKTGDLASGIVAGIDAILAVVAQEKLAAPGPKATADPGEEFFAGGKLNFRNIGENTWLITLGMLAVCGALLRFFLGNLLGSGVIGGVTAGIGWLFTGSVAGTLIGGAIGVVVALFGFELLLSGVLGGGGRSRGGGGFSGGGGSGGGGGASGSW